MKAFAFLDNPVVQHIACHLLSDVIRMNNFLPTVCYIFCFRFSFNLRIFSLMFVLSNPLLTVDCGLISYLYTAPYNTQQNFEIVFLLLLKGYWYYCFLPINKNKTIRKIKKNKTKKNPMILFYFFQFIKLRAL